jgi:threonine dehydrogenase-like Zn-dependent dehydrogenase
MRAAVLDYQTHQLEERQLAGPHISSPDEVLFRVHEVGVCGTDRRLAAFKLGYPPEGETYLVPGHEALGEVMEAGPQSGFARGEWVTPVVRRPCEPPCPSCARARRDLCTSGGYKERGIFGLHGYFREYAVDAGSDLVRVPEALVDVAVLIEPLSVVEKAIATALRMHEPGAQTALVLGAGPIGLLSAMALRLRRLDVTLHSLEPPHHPRVRLVEAAGIRYAPAVEPADIVIEATGSPDAAFAALRRMPPLGVMAVLGSSNASGEMPFLDMIVNNQAVFGSVNASPEAFQQAVEDLGRMDRAVLRGMIRRTAFADFRNTIPAPSPDSTKVVHRFD